MKTVKKSSWDKLWLQCMESQLVGDSITEPYKEHQTIYMVLDAIASCLPSVEYKLYTGEDENELKEGPLVELFNKPNSMDCRFQLWEATVLYFCYYGETFWLFNKSIKQERTGEGLPAEIWVENPSDYQEIIQDGQLMAWRKKNRVLSLEEILHFRKFNMFNRIRGFSPMIPIKALVDMDYKAMLYNKAFFNNSAELGGYLSTEQKLTDSQMERLIRQFEARHKGPKNAKKPGVLEGGLKYQSATESHRDMEFLEQRRYTREEILGIWRVPKSMFSITEDLNYATARVQKRIFWENSIIPILYYIQEKLNASFFPIYAPEVKGYFDFSMIPELQDDFNSKVDTAIKLFNIGVPMNEINNRLDLGFDERPEWEIGYLPAMLMPVGGETEIELEAKPEVKPEAKPEAKIKAGIIDAAKERVISPIIKRLTGKVKSYLIELRVEVLKNIEKSFNKSLDPINWEKMNEILKKKMKSNMLSSIFYGVKMAELIGRLKLDEQIMKHKIVSMLQTKLTGLETINKTLKKNIAGLISEGMSEGESVAQIADRVKEFFNGISDVRARMIAQTETIGSYNAGTIMAYKEGGIKRKKWLSARDDKVRDTHARETGVDGEIVNIDQNFSNGVDYPGGNGPAEEVVNCRCTIIPVYEGEGE